MSVRAEAAVGDDVGVFDGSVACNVGEEIIGVVDASFESMGAAEESYPGSEGGSHPEEDTVAGVSALTDGARGGI